MPTPFVADAADEAVRSNSILNERKATDIIEETALEVDIRAWRAEGLRLLQAASAREDHVPNGARRPSSFWPFLRAHASCLAAEAQP